jgi:hypothetical protein
MNVSNNSSLERYIDTFLISLKYNSAVRNVLGDDERKGFITCSGKNDGGGAQALAIMSTMLFAHDLGLTYVHTPFIEIAHNDNDDDDWEIKWEDFFGLGAEESHISDFSDSSLKVIDLSALSKVSSKRDEILYRVSQCHKYGNFSPDRYSFISSSLKNKYRLSDKSKYSLNIFSNRVKISIHVRRGDISSVGLNASRYTHNDSILRILNQILQESYNLGLKLSIHLFSQGVKEDFGELQNLDIEFHLNECVFSTFHNLVDSDVLIMSKSTFSYTAALLSNGVKIYEPFYHKPLKDWIPINRRGGISSVSFRAKIIDHLCRSEKLS